MDLVERKITDFSKWLRKDVWSIENAAYLLCGFDPECKTPLPNFRIGLGGVVYSRVEEIEDIGQEISDSIYAGVIKKENGNKSDGYYPKTYIDWALRKVLDIPKPLLEWYEKQKPRNKTSTVKKTPSDLSSNLRNEFHVSEERIKELSLIKNNDFDFRRLIHICKELNLGYQAGQTYALPLLVRCILDHIPPIFNCKNFAEVASNYSEGTKSFRENTKHLESFSRKIGDSFLHTQIRKSESLPNWTQVDFRASLDVVLAEIVRILR